MKHTCGCGIIPAVVALVGECRGRGTMARLARNGTALAVLMGLATGLVPRAEAVSATGGNYTNEIPGYRIHVFTTDGTLNVLDTGNAQVLVVGGGGGGGQRVGGGGGAGGVVYATNYNLTLGLKAITVGGGGAGATANGALAGNGTNSYFDVSGGSGYTITAYGGGGGSSYNRNPGAGADGGSGGGGNYSDVGGAHSNTGGVATTGAWTGVTGAIGYGNAGGASYTGSGYGGGGGGGAGGVGGNASSTLGGGGGVGRFLPQFVGLVPNTLSDGWFAGGGGAGATSTTAGPGGMGGGASGKAGNNLGVSDSGRANSGGGGGGGSDNSGGTQSTGGNGGSGIVAVRYAVPMAWTYSMPIAFTNDSRLNTLTNFPALVILDANKVNYSQFLANGQDLRFLDSSGAELPYEVDSWMSSGAPSNSHIWVKVPALTAGCTVTAYWGNASATMPSYRTNGTVWADGYAGVWHLRNGVTLSGVDSIATPHNGTTGTHATATSGLIEGGGRFDGDINAYVNMGTFDPLPGGTGTASIWVNWATTNGNLWPMAKGADYASGNSWGFSVQPQGASQCNVQFFYDTSGAAYGSTAAISSGTNVWHHLAAVMRSGAQDLYVDGVLKFTKTRATLTFGTGNQFNIGKTDRASPYQYAFNGSLDEARVETVQRSSNWVWACYANQAMSAPFAACGAVSAFSSSGEPAIQNLAVSGVQTNVATFNGWLTSTGTSATAVYVLWGQDTNAWANTNAFTGVTWTNNSFPSTNITLTPNQQYFYSFGASNAASNVVVSSPQYLITGEVTVEASDATAQYHGNNGEFTIRRPADLTNSALTVNYTLAGSTAIGGTDYTALPASVTLNAGVASTTLAVAPLYSGMPTSRTVLLTLAAGPYAIGATSNSATVTIQPKGPIHVTPTGTSNGTSWNEATSLTNALRIAVSNDTIWSVGGTYSMGTVVTAATAVTWIGGFAGTETAVSQRALTNALGVVTNYTAINGEGSHKCLAITANGDVWLDTLSISNSTLPRALEKSSGTGLLTLNNCRIEKNALAGSYVSGTGNGMGAYFSAGRVYMTNCVVSGNRYPGGNTQYQNTGLGLYASGVILDIVDSIFSNQYAIPDAAGANDARQTYGAGMGFINGTCRVARTEFIGNLGSGGGGTGGGGAVYLGSTSGSLLSFSNCVFRGNAVQYYGSAGSGGAIFADMGSGRTSSFVNCTFAYNTNMTVNGWGGAICVRSGALELKNCILWTNRVTGAGATGHELYATNSTSSITNSYMCFTGTNTPLVVAEGGAVINWGAGVITNDPLFASATDLHLKSAGGRWNPATSSWTNDAVTSPCIDAGTGAAGSEPDPNGGIVNLGAYGGTRQASKTPSAPVITNGALVEMSMNEDAGTLSLSSLGLAAADPCDVAWAWTNVAGSGPANGSVAVNGTGTNPVWTAFTYTPNPNFNGTNTFDVKVTALSTLLSDTVTVRVVVNPLNDPPTNTVSPGFVATTYEAGSVWTVDSGTWNDNADTNAVYDGSGLTFSYQWYCSNSPSATAIANATNATFTPGSEWLGSNLNVAVSCIDTGYPGAATTTVVTAWGKVLGAANTAPTILVNGIPADSVTTNITEDAGVVDLSGLGLSATDDGVGGAGVTWTNITLPVNGTVSVSGTGTNVVTWTPFAYTPNANFNGTNSFVVRAKDIPNASASITVTVVVAAINDPPVNTVAPGYSGTRLVGNTLTATNGVWNDDADTNASYTAANFVSAATFTYQWWRSANADGSASNAIPGATAATYTLTENDRFKYVSVAVTCTDGNYPAGSSSNTAYSAWQREATPPPIYVTTTGIGGGTSWADATSLTNALRICPTSNMIWIAQGVYTSAASGARFTVASNGVALYGGFTNGMESLAERDWVAHPASLDGLGTTDNVVRVTGANVILDGLIISNGAYRALSKTSGGALALANCRIEKNALASGYTFGTGNGLGAYLTAGSVLMTNCVIANNQYPGSDLRYHNYGLAVYASDITLDIVDCVFSNQYGEANAARGLKGAGLAFINGTCRVARTSFIGNIGSGNGGGGAGVYLGNGASLRATFSNCLFRANLVQQGGGTAGGGGGAVFGELNAAGTAAFVNCTFVANTNAQGSSAGGAVVLTAGGTLELKNCILWTNRVTGAGSAGHDLSRSGGSLNVRYSSVSGQSAPYTDGTVTFDNSREGDPRFASLVDVHLQSPAGRWDPGAQDFVTSDTQYSPCIDAGDPADLIRDEPTDNGNIRINMGYYGGTAQASKSPPSTPPQLADRGATVNYHRALVSGELTNATFASANVYLCYGIGDGGITTGGWSGVVSVGEKLNGAVFAQWTPALSPATTYTYRWYAVNISGSVWTETNTFVTGATAPGGGVNVIHVNKSAAGASDGSDWANAYPAIANGIAAIGGSRTNIWITGGSYSEGARLNLGASAVIVGGFAGTETSIAQRALTNAAGVVTNHTVINGEGVHGCLNITAGSVWLDSLTCSNAVLEGAEYGGLRWSSPGTLVANNCRFVKNKSPDSDQKHGLGVKVTAGNVLLTRCVVADNTELCWGSFGFGIYSVGANLTLADCVVSNNSGDGFATRGSVGCGLYFDNGALSALRTDFLDNAGGVNNGSGGGGGVFIGGNANMSASFVNCVFRGNRALDTGSGKGGAVWANLNSLAKTVTVVNCTFADNRNETTGGAGGAVFLSQGTLALKNSIFWTNTVKDGVSGSEIYATNAASRVVVSYSDFTGTNTPHVVAAGGAVVEWGLGMLTTDPLFTSGTDVHLKSDGGRWDPATGTWVIDAVTSPCIDAGDPADSVGAEPEPNKNRINMGAYGGTVQASRSGIPRGSVFKFR